MTPLLKLAPNESYWIQINSVPNCDECEVYAQEFRDFIGGIPGWKATGAAVVFWDSSVSSYGLRLEAAEGTSPEMQRKLSSAFAAASIPLSPLSAVKYGDNLSGVIVIGRRPK